MLAIFVGITAGGFTSSEIDFALIALSLARYKVSRANKKHLELAAG